VTRRLAFALGAILLMTTTAFAAELPPGKWWRRPDIQQMLQLTEEQQSRLDGIYLSAADELIDLRGGAEKASIALRAELDQSQLNRQNIRAAGHRLGEARGRLFERELQMLVDMRAALNDSQWNRLRMELDKLGQPQAMRPNQPMRPNQRKNQR
jgi:hypothetical protein